MKFKTKPVSLVLACLIWNSASVYAQVAENGEDFPAQASPSSNVAPAAAPAATDAVTPRRGWKIQPSVSADFLSTDNVRLTPQAQTDFVTTLSPSVNIAGESARAKGTLALQLQHVSYANNNSSERNQRSVNGSGTLELIDKWLYLDAKTNVSQQTVSAFGTQSFNNTAINANKTETTTYQVSPYIKGHLASFADYQVRLDQSSTRADSTAVTSSKTRQLQAQLSGKTGLTTLAWNFDSTVMRNEYQNGQSNFSNSANLGLKYTIDPQFKIIGSLGKEGNNYTSTETKYSSTSSYGFEWAPGSLTKVVMSRDKRFFGNGHNYSFNYQSARSALKFVDSKTIQTTPQRQGSSNLGTIYDLYYAMLASSIPDPAERETAVNTALAGAGISPNTLVTLGFLSSQASLTHNQEISYSIIGVRNTVTFSAQKSERSQVATNLTLVDDFSTSTRILQRGFTANWSHKLTQFSSLSFLASNNRTSGLTSAQDSKLKSYNLMFNTHLGAYTTGSIGIRQAHADNQQGTGYTEHAVLGTIGIKF